MDTPISFKGYKIIEITYTTKNNESITENYEPTVSVAINEDYTQGQVNIKSTLNLEHKQIYLEMAGVFTLNKTFTENQEELKQYLSQNGSAMLLPYVRSIVSILTTLDSEQAILLPTVNFNQLLEDNQ